MQAEVWDPDLEIIFTSTSLVHLLEDAFPDLSYALLD